MEIPTMLDIILYKCCTSLPALLLQTSLTMLTNYVCANWLSGVSLGVLGVRLEQQGSTVQLAVLEMVTFSHCLWTCDWPGIRGALMAWWGFMSIGVYIYHTHVYMKIQNACLNLQSLLVDLLHFRLTFENWMFLCIIPQAKLSNFFLRN